MPTQLPYLKGTSQFLTTGGEGGEVGEAESSNFLKVDWQMQLYQVCGTI